MTDDHASASQTTPRPASRALTVMPRAEESRRPLAGFVAQLIACEKRLAPFRRARREEPAGAASAYGAATGRTVAHLAIDLKV